VGERDEGQYVGRWKYRINTRGGVKEMRKKNCSQKSLLQANSKYKMQEIVDIIMFHLIR